MTQAVTYARFSPRPNAEEARSIETQTQQAIAYCKAHGWTIVGDFSDPGLSGKDTKRPGLQAALEMMDKLDGEGVLIVYSFSRLARSVKDLLTIVERINGAGGHVVSLHDSIDTTTPAGRMMLGVVGSIDQFNREIGAERTKDAMLQYQANGRRMSDRCPYGMERDQSRPELYTNKRGEQATRFRFLRRNASECDVMRRIDEMHAGGLGIRTIAKMLNDDGLDIRGKPWSHTAVHRVLRRNKHVTDDRPEQGADSRAHAPPPERTALSSQERV